MVLVKYKDIVNTQKIIIPTKERELSITYFSCQNPAPYSLLLVKIIDMIHHFLEIMKFLKSKQRNASNSYKKNFL